MKKIILSLTILLSVMLASCKDEEVVLEKQEPSFKKEDFFKVDVYITKKLVNILEKNISLKEDFFQTIKTNATTFNAKCFIFKSEPFFKEDFNLNEYGFKKYSISLNYPLNQRDGLNYWYDLFYEKYNPAEKDSVKFLKESMSLFERDILDFYVDSDEKWDCESLSKKLLEKR